MRIININFILILCSIVFKCCCQDNPAFRIIAPQNICSKQEKNSTNVSNGIIISFQPRDGMKLSYKFRIFFKILPPQTFTQRETLLIWKAVRALEHRMNAKERLQISNDNLVYIAKSELISGVSYIVHVVGITDAGNTSEDKIFNIIYADGALQNEYKSEGINFLLIGSEIAMATATFSVTAKVSFCKPKLKYYIQWTIRNIDVEFEYLQNVIGSTLTIPANTLRSGYQNVIESAVVETSSATILAKESLTVNVLSRGLQVYILPTYAKIGIDKELIFELFIREFDNYIQKPQITWEFVCLNAASEDCSYYAVGETRFKVYFHRIGSYQIVANVEVNEVVRKVVSNVDVISDIFVSYDFSQMPMLDAPSNTDLHFNLLVMDLIANCHVKWQSLQEEGFAQITQEEISRHHFGEASVTDMEQNYLSEIADFGNYTVNKEVLLHIKAPPHNATKATWQGLKGDARYNFRLTALCPAPYRAVVAGQTDTKYVASHFDLTLHTNAPPKIGRTEVEPDQGLALKTIFIITLADAKDLLQDAPLSFELCGNFAVATLCFGKFFEYKTWETVLPLTETGFALYVRVCDVRSACSEKNVTPINMTYEAMTQEEYKMYTEQITDAFVRHDFSEGHNLICLAALTYKFVDTAMYAQLKNWVKQLLLKEFNKLHEYPTKKVYIPQTDIENFVYYAKVNMEILGIHEATFHEKLLEILEQLTPDFLNEPHRQPTQADFEGAEKLKRFANSQPTHKQMSAQYYVTPAYARMNLELLNTISKNKEHDDLAAFKKYITTRSEYLVDRLCQRVDLKHTDIVTEAAALHITKLSGKRILKKENFIANAYNGASGGGIILELLQNKHIYKNMSYCVAVTQYPTDPFSFDVATVLNVFIKDTTSLRNLKYIELNDETQNGLRHAFQLSVNKRSTSENACAMMAQGQWTTDFCKVVAENATYITCVCNNLGYFRLLSKRDLNANKAFATTTKFIVTNIEQPLTTERVTAFSVNQVTSTTTESHKNSNLSNAIMKPNNVQKDIEHTSVAKVSKLTLLVIPILLIMVVAVFIIVVIYRNRRAEKATMESIVNFTLQPRQRKNGIYYPLVYDEELLK